MHFHVPKQIRPIDIISMTVGITIFRDAIDEVQQLVTATHWHCLECLGVLYTPIYIVNSVIIVAL